MRRPRNATPPKSLMRRLTHSWMWSPWTPALIINSLAMKAFRGMWRAKKHNAGHSAGELPRITANHCRESRRGRVTGPLLPVLLDARRPQAGEAVLIDRILPGERFLDGERVAAAGLLERQESAAHRRHHLGLAPDDPALGTRRRQICDRQRTAVRPDNVLGPRSK